jgi:hypothetical protein
MRIVAAVISPVLLCVSACAFEERSRNDYERHSNSQMEISRTDESMLVFEAKTGAAFPESSKAAEAKRMEWLQSWLDRGGYCPDGHEIVSRRKVEPGEINFYDMDLRYEVRCTDPPPMPIEE